MIRRFGKDSDVRHVRRSSLFLIVRLALLGAFLLSACAQAGSIFDDDGTPPAPVKPAVPPADAPEVKPEPVKPNTPEPPKPDTTVAPAGRKPKPSAADRAKSRAIFDKLYANEMADHTPAARRALANKLIDQAATMKDSPSDQYMLLIGATTAGKEASDLTICFRAADAMAETFEVDALRFKSETTAKVKLRAETPTVTTDNCQAALKLVDQLIAAGDYLPAAQIVKSLRTVAPTGPLASQIQTLGKTLDNYRIAEDHVAPFVKKLKTTPNDATANLEVGRYLCFIKRDWQTGCSLLAKGGKANLSAAAALDLAGATDPEKQAELGDAWWSLADKEAGLAQSAMRQRAAHWYGIAVGSQTLSGIKRVLLDQRITAAALKGEDLTPLEINVPANACRTKDLAWPVDATMVTAHIDPMHDHGQSWGVGLAIGWSNGRYVQINVRDDEGRWGIRHDGAEDLVGGYPRGKPATVVIKLTDKSVELLAQIDGDPEQKSIFVFRREDYPGLPTTVRVGKIGTEWAPRDNGEKGPTNPCRVDWVKFY